MNTTKNSVTDFDTLEQYDDFGAIYGAFTLQVERWENFDDFAREIQTPDVTTWYENIITGWAAGTPDYYTTEVYAVGDLPESIDAYNFDDLSDDQREEIAGLVRDCLDNPHSDQLAARAGLIHLGSFATDHRFTAEARQITYLRSLADFLESIDYDDQISF